MRTNKRRLHRLETAIRPPDVQELSADEKAVRTMLIYTRRFLPDLLAQAEAWRANGCPPASPAEREAGAAMRERFDRLMPAVIDANTRTNESIAQGRAESIIERLTAWGLWREPDPPPPDAPAILERLEALLA